MTRTSVAPASCSGRAASSEQPGLLRSLGIAGWGALEPAILAALATESPILLIGPHGTAKTLLLQRLAEALGLAFRHYNASILSFDDLLGYPVPQDGRLVYLQTPATIWEAEAVLFDEVSRCRPELQNKLFPLIHERVAQGLPLTRLRHRDASGSSANLEASWNVPLSAIGGSRAAPPRAPSGGRHSAGAMPASSHVVHAGTPGTPCRPDGRRPRGGAARRAGGGPGTPAGIGIPIEGEHGQAALRPAAQLPELAAQARPRRDPGGRTKSQPLDPWATSSRVCSGWTPPAQHVISRRHISSWR